MSIIFILSICSDDAELNFGFLLVWAGDFSVSYGKMMSGHEGIKQFVPKNIELPPTSG